MASVLEKVQTEENIQYPLNDVFSYLVYNRILNSAYDSDDYSIENFRLESWDFDEDDIPEGLPIPDRFTNLIQQEIFRNSASLLPDRDTEVLYYEWFGLAGKNDLTSCEAQDLTADAVKAGVRKSGSFRKSRSNLRVRFGLFTDSDGIPVWFNVFSNSQNEQISTNKETVKDLHKMTGTNSFIYWAKAGLDSSSIEAALDSSPVHFSSALEESIGSLSEDDQEKVLDSADNKSGNLIACSILFLA